MLNDNEKSFSKRHGYSGKEKEITIREDAPSFLRNFVISQAQEEGLTIGTILGIVCNILRESKEGHWGNDYIEREVYNHINSCEWYKVYDIAEAIYSYLKKQGFNTKHTSYADKFNELCSEEGIGWHFQNDKIVSRGSEIGEKISNLLINELSEKIYPTARSELQEAFNDISRRPTPDLTGCVQHSVAALECVARKVTGDEKATLGEIIKRNPTLFPRPLDVVAEKIWGYASEKARHIKEGNVPTFREAMLMIGLSSALIAFLNEPDIKIDHDLDLFEL